LTFEQLVGALAASAATSGLAVAYAQRGI